MILFHHSRPFATVSYGIVKPHPAGSSMLEFRGIRDAYQWLEVRVGFFPLFLAAGTQEWQLQMTGYQDQWRRLIGYDSEAERRIYRGKGEFPNYVLFSFHEEDLREGVFIDEDAWWVFICGAFLNDQADQVTDAQVRSVFKKSWPRSRWLREARSEDSQLPVCLLVPSLDLSKAERVWVRNRSTEKRLADMGFKNVQVKRLRLPQI